MLTLKCRDESCFWRLRCVRVWCDQCCFHICDLVAKMTDLVLDALGAVLLAWCNYLEHVHECVRRRRAACRGLIRSRLCPYWQRRQYCWQTNHSQHDSKTARLGHVDGTISTVPVRIFYRLPIGAYRQSYACRYDWQTATELSKQAVVSALEFQYLVSLKFSFTTCHMITGWRGAWFRANSTNVINIILVYNCSTQNLLK